MRYLVGWVALAICMCGLNADLIAHLHHRIPGFPIRSCVFPFTYGDVLYYNCISVHSDFAWCSFDRNFQGRWWYCTAMDPPNCTFPFYFRGEVFHKCTKKGYVLNRSSCSLTADYNKDKKWKQCSPQK
ncbi:Bovine seminal plasma protein-like protein 1 [Heterocephalus glaber]|uniref:Seminal plasma protein-like protein 1 n=1 Tax=Heterocephalus glaber TaxID=10181 RepID=G5B896_HETGA|nr:Bovine seminal plasma protein-like protein 1 [Heterocephalus glaber]